MTRYNLQSAFMIHTPGLVSWAVNGYAFEEDRTRLEGMFVEGYGLPIEAARALLSEAVPYDVVEGDIVTFEFDHNTGG